MLAISIRQPWAHFIIHYGKDIENRTWPTRYRGRVLIHASKGMTRDEWDEAILFAKGARRIRPFDLKPEHNRTPQTIERGGIVGAAEIVDCVRDSESPWFVGPYGFVIANARPLPFFPCKGALGFFEVAEFDARQTV